MEETKKREIEEYETYNVEELLETLGKKYQNQYQIVEENKKREYRFPFFFRTKYVMKVEITNYLQQLENEKTKQSLLASLKKDKAAARPRFFEKEQEIKAHLMEQEIKEEIVNKWFEELKKENPEALTEDQVVEKLKQKIETLLTRTQNQSLSGVCLFFGVTGIGKTTTVVKIAKLLEKNKKVGIITTDNYKMGAYHQIEQYAKKLDIPLKTSKVNELDFPINALKYGEGKEVILIDTAGRSPKHPEMKDEIENYIREIKPDRNVLVLSANQKFKDMQYTVEVFEETGITDFIITKTDETSSYGFIVNLMDRFDKSILYITDGQEVPGDIKKMDPDFWAEQLFEGYKK